MRTLFLIVNVTDAAQGGCEAKLTQEVLSQMSGHVALHLQKNKQNTYWIGGGLLAGIVWVKELARTMKLYFDSSSFNSDWTSSLSLCNSKEEAGSWGSPPGREQTKCTQDMLYTWWLNFLWLRNFCHLKRSNVKCIETSISHDILYIVLRFSRLYYSE